MTDKTSPVSEPVEVDFDDAFGDWLSGAGVTQHSVEVHSKPQLMAKFQDLERRAKLEQGINAQDASQADEAGMSPELLAEYEALYSEWQASKSVWYVRELNDKDRALIGAATKRFEALPDDATDEQVKDRRAAIEVEQANVNLRTIAAATVRIVFGADGGKVVNLPALEELDDLNKRVEKLRPMVTQVGEAAALKIMQGVAEASAREADIPAPKSLTPSQKGRG